MDRMVNVFSNGVFRRKGNTILFESDKGSRYLPVESVREIIVHGEVDFNKRFLEFLSEKEITMHYFNHYGYYMGTFYPREHYNSGFMTLKQAEFYLDSAKRLELAQAFVSGAAQNILKVLRYYANRGKDVSGSVVQIEQLATFIETTKKIPELMALEGNMRELYYQNFDVILAGSGFTFQKRSRRPPTNQLNALISFGNSLMYSIVLAEIYKTHVDPRIGYLHTTNDRRFSLHLDISEIFKPIIVDRLIFTLIAKRMITLKDFGRLEGGIVMSEKARKTFVEGFDERLRQVIRQRKIRRMVSYRRLIRMEIYKLEKHFLGDERYEPFVAQW
ncbi:type I-B CRISPR-associated endonuclease Cas1b [Sulfobacillus thermosulfidooxidans]|uniref:type I-B CRISPR-associated endonuclease Cas1b n=1 Tax=Sulfobacillus thermosulfidooxidans TaxID=28034 RepID=UPI0003F652DD|nr:type I-B CRISPR-associated endonuclease Cas1b [Sulfobacillus thermosulfidooxidans]